MSNERTKNCNHQYNSAIDNITDVSNDTIVIVAIKRTPIGALGGIYKNFSAIEIASQLIKKTIKDIKFSCDTCELFNNNNNNNHNNFNKRLIENNENISNIHHFSDTNNFANLIDTLYLGNVLQANLGQGPARQAAINAGLRDEVVCSTINKVCGSGMVSIINGMHAISSNDANIVIAGGMENMSMAPYMLENGRFGMRFGNSVVIDHMFKDGLHDQFLNLSMGQIAEDTAQEYGFSKDVQNDFTFKSCEKALKAQKDGKFANEIIDIEVKGKIFKDDETLNSINLEKIATLKPAFRKDGTITAASASSISDGASICVLMKYSTAKMLNIQPIAKIAGYAEYAEHPKNFIQAPIGAVNKMLKRIHWDIDYIDLFEINEAFAIVPMCLAHDMKVSIDKINIYGGACALGHPLGVSGCRILTTLINALQSEKKQRGVAALCVGGGEGVCMAVEMMQ